MEVFAYCLGVCGIMSLLGACALIFRSGNALLQAQEVLSVAVRTHSDTMKALNDFRETSDKAHTQVQNWILETNVAIETSETKSQNVREFCAKRYIDTEKRLEAIEKTFAELSNTPNLLN